MKKVDDGVKVMRSQDLVLHNYTAAPFCIDRYCKCPGSHIKMNANFIMDKFSTSLRKFW